MSVGESSFVLRLFAEIACTADERTVHLVGMDPGVCSRWLRMLRGESLYGQARPQDQNLTSHGWSQPRHVWGTQRERQDGFDVSARPRPCTPSGRRIRLRAGLHLGPGESL